MRLPADLNSAGSDGTCVAGATATRGSPSTIGGNRPSGPALNSEHDPRVSRSKEPQWISAFFEDVGDR